MFRSLMVDRHAPPSFPWCTLSAARSQAAATTTAEPSSSGADQDAAARSATPTPPVGRRPSSNGKTGGACVTSNEAFSITYLAAATPPRAATPARRPGPDRLEAGREISNSGTLASARPNRQRQAGDPARRQVLRRSEAGGLTCGSAAWSPRPAASSRSARRQPGRSRYAFQLGAVDAQLQVEASRKKLGKLKTHRAPGVRRQREGAVPLLDAGGVRWHGRRRRHPPPRLGGRRRATTSS